MLDFSKNYFDLFGMPVGFLLDTDELTRRYRDLQRVVHPDRFAHAGDYERRLSMQGATRINEAYQTLKDPLARARYLLSLSGVDLEQDGGTTTDTEFLMEQMELREALEGAGRQPEPHVTLAELTSRINQNVKLYTARLAVQLDTRDSEQLGEAAETVRKMQFLEKLRDEVERVEAELEDAV
jgi:molecular chaperone HscB